MPVYRLGGEAPQFADPKRIFMAPGSVLVGKVACGLDVSIWFGACLRGDNDEIQIGDGCNIQEDVVVHVDAGWPTRIGANCTIGHRAVVHGCTIGENSLIGIGAIVLNGARIGKCCLVGAGALVTEGKVVPDYSLAIGSPAKVVRTLSEEEIDKLSASAQNYRRNGRHYLSNLSECIT